MILVLVPPRVESRALAPAAAEQSSVSEVVRSQAASFIAGACAVSRFGYLDAARFVPARSSGLWSVYQSSWREHCA